MGVCYRIGGDEFAVCIDRADPKRIEKALQELRGWLERENQTEPMALRIAWGYAIRRDEKQSAQTALNQADRRMYTHKQQIKRIRLLEES
ncbi:MAG TPA: diguanylate cyclase [Firmicutes bacterium]|nr:diguanylate cyclase [Bacillota bacterium]